VYIDFAGIATSDTELMTPHTDYLTQTYGSIMLILYFKLMLRQR